VFDSSAKFPVGLLAGNQYQMGHYDECIEILVDAGESFGGQLKGQYCLAEIWFESSFSPRTDPYTLNYDPKVSAWEKIKVRNNTESMTANITSNEFVYMTKTRFLHAPFAKYGFYNMNKLCGITN
jgi:hypothetical protein